VDVLLEVEVELLVEVEVEVELVGLRNQIQLNLL
jgi:hypothetical protein